MASAGPDDQGATKPTAGLAHKKGLAERLGRVAGLLLLIWGVAGAAYFYGYLSVKHQWFPAPQVAAAKGAANELLARARGRVAFPYATTKAAGVVVVHNRAAMAPGLTLVNGVGPKGALFARLVDADGAVVHAWDLDWFRLWPHPTHLPEDALPKERPGGHVHGIDLASNGDLTFNFEDLGMMQVDVCGRPKWRLPERTNHTISRDDDGNFWTNTFVDRQSPMARLPNMGPPIKDPEILKVSPEGRVLKRISVFELLQNNRYPGLLYMASTEHDAHVSGDTLHVNAVEVFPSTMTSDIFAPGDVMISLRNINTILVFDQASLAIKAIVTGRFVRQHDPHFVDGSTITVFDNNNLGYNDHRASSRIVRYSMKDDSERVLFEGTPDHPFYTYIMGTQHRLDNGDLLLTESISGRALEVSPTGEIVWEYFNKVKPGVVGLLDEAKRIPPSVMSAARVRELKTQCPTS